MLDHVLKNFPSELLFHVTDAWLTSKDLCALDSSIANKEVRSAYLSVLATGKVLQHHTLILNDSTLQWMASRNVTAHNLRLSLSQLGHLLSTKYTPFENLRFVRQLSVTCDVSSLDKLQLEDSVYSRFPMLTSLAVLGSCDHTLPMRETEHFTKFVVNMSRSSPQLQTIEFSRLEAVTDSLVHTVCTASNIRHLLLDCCPMVSCQGVEHSLRSSRALSELTWRSLDPIPVSSLVQAPVPAPVTSPASPSAGLRRLSLVGPGFSQASILDLSACSPHLQSLSISHADVLDEVDVVHLSEHLGARLVTLVLLGCRLVTSAMVDAVSLNCHASRLTCLRLQSLERSRLRRQPVPEVDGGGSRLSLPSVLRLATKHGAHLHNLQLSGISGVSDRMVHAVCKMCVHIQQLDLTDNDLLTDQALQSLQGCVPRSLRQLFLSPTRFFSDAARVALQHRLQDRLYWQ